ncbi:FemAB family XrtA/PEP-CTERM system-associated protein [Kordiimonas aestuarii]|uniref:FemAB family XrtA/PEP-CTERM system-associated protein n=1 Tax=Kordiimonas aestuarii TaxID=1005925 RepID=UPI0021D3197C|nr:FemAB family XrtA/PEP-CTERM system-associated protein [Kordiimonas aestuarii]
MAISIRELDRGSMGVWDRYVQSHPEGTFCHRAGWKFAVEAGTGHKCPFLYADDGGTVVGVLPLSMRKSLLFGNALISSMFAVYGGALYRSDGVRDQLYDAAWRMAEKAGIRFFENRTITPDHDDTPGWHSLGGKSATFIRDIPSEDDDAVLLAIPRKQRAVVRKALANDLTCNWQPDIADVYSLYAESVRNLGTPVFPLKLFSAFTHEFPDNTCMQLIKAPDGVPVASLFSFYDEKTVLPYYAGGSPGARRYGAHDFMYYTLMCWARKRGIQRFDFGRSKVDSGPYSFKKNWGFEPQELAYECRLAPGEDVPNLSPQNGKYALMVKVWKQLPLAIANRLGPILARHLG